MSTETPRVAPKIDRFLRLMTSRGASDFHLTVGRPPVLRVSGTMEPIRYRTLVEADYVDLVRPIVPPRLWEPFALLMPFDTRAASTAQSLFQRFGINVIRLNRRINFKMPNLGWDGKGSDYSVAWFCWGLPDLRQPVTYGHIPLARQCEDWLVKPKNRKEIKDASSGWIVQTSSADLDDRENS